MGIKEWLEPQISEHWPKYKPTREGLVNNWLIRPGRASTFKPKEGKEKEWITSVEVIRRRDVVFTGKKKSEEQVKRRGISATPPSIIESNS